MRSLETEQEDEVPVPARWYHLQGEQQYGPLDLDSMRRLVMGGTIGPDTYVWADGMEDWLPAREVPALVPPVDPAAVANPPMGPDRAGDPPPPSSDS